VQALAQGNRDLTLPHGASFVQHRIIKHMAHCHNAAAKAPPHSAGSLNTKGLTKVAELFGNSTIASLSGHSCKALAHLGTAPSFSAAGEDADELFSTPDLITYSNWATMKVSTDVSQHLVHHLDWSAGGWKSQILLLLPLFSGTDLKTSLLFRVPLEVNVCLEQPRTLFGRRCQVHFCCHVLCWQYICNTNNYLSIS
jgi:hypothetical protein